MTDRTDHINQAAGVFALADQIDDTAPLELDKTQLVEIDSTAIDIDDTAPVEVGSPGPAGQSAYDIAVEHGFQGTTDDWLDSLQGVDGRNGATVEGDSAYQIAVNAGFTGTVAQWLNSLQGRNSIASTIDAQYLKDGGLQGLTDSYLSALENGYKGTKNDWLLTFSRKEEASPEQSKTAQPGNVSVINKKNDSPLGQTVFTVGSFPKWFGLLKFATPRRYFKAVSLIASALERRVQFEGAAIVEVDGQLLLESTGLYTPKSLITRQTVENMIDNKILVLKMQLEEKE